MNIERLILNRFQPIFKDRRTGVWSDTSHVDYFGQSANDFVRSRLCFTNNKGLMIAKFGTVELNNLCAYIASEKNVKTFSEYWWYLRGYQSLYPNDTFAGLCNNAGFFPSDISLGYKWKDMVLGDVQEIDILGSYIRQEKRINKYIRDVIRVEIEGYLAPFVWDNPWTSVLKNKKVLVIHPFVESIARQYEKRKFLFDNPDVLPDFEDLFLIKAVQSIAGNGVTSGNASWFEALQHMKDQMSKCEYDIALVGCGAYGMHLAAHAKRMGKIGIHMAGWTQMLFGIYGNRWLIDQPQYSRYINEYWVRPSDKEKPINADVIENGCYW